MGFCSFFSYPRFYVRGDCTARCHRAVPASLRSQYTTFHLCDTANGYPARAGSNKQLPLAERCREGVATMVRPVLAECLRRGEVRRSSRDGKTTYVACVDAGEVIEAGEGVPYSELPQGSRPEVRRLAEEIKELANRSAQGIVEIGRHLLKAKKHLAHGLFGRWLRDEFSWTTRQAQRFMNVAEEFGKNDNLSHLGPAALYLLAA